MAAGKYDIVIEQGVDLTLQVSVQDGTGATYSLAGSTAAAQIRDDYNGNLLASFTATTANGVTGRVDLALSAATASALPLSGGKWDLLLTTSGGAKVRLLNGSVTISGKVTE